MDNEEASASGIITLVSVFLLAGLLFVLDGAAVDRIMITAISMMGQPISQMRVDTIKLMILVFQAQPFILLLGIGMNHWINSLRQYSGETSLSTIAIGAIEMQILTVVTIALTLFGGGAIEFVIDFINKWPVLGYDIGVFSAVQYAAPVFYGICFLILIGAVLQFFVLCFQVVDYSYSA